MITAVITSMGRREHLEIGLPRALDTFDKVVVVDWSCPKGSGEYAASEGASVAYKYGEKYFNGSAAKNYGAKLVTSDYICFIDADAVCMPGMKDIVKALASPDCMVLSPRNDDGSDVNDTVGFIICPTDAFWNVGGFDSELWKGWGHEDIHLRAKLYLDEKLKVKRLPHMMLGAIAHSNELRSRYHEKPIGETAVEGFPKLKAWFESKGIENFNTNPKVSDIVFHGKYNVD